MLSSEREKVKPSELKDILGLQLVPRRKRMSKSLDSTGLPATHTQNPDGREVKTRMTSQPVSRSAEVAFKRHPLVVTSELAKPLAGRVVPGHVLDALPDALGDTEKSSPLQQNNHGDNNRKGNGNPNPTGLTGSEGPVRRAVKTSNCGLCGDCKYIPSQWQKRRKNEPKCISPMQFRIKCNTRTGNAIIIKTPKEIIIWIGKYPKVKLCDIAQKCDVGRQNCSYVLPEVLKTKVVRCFRRELKAGVRLGLSCSCGDKHGSEESVLTKSNESYHSIQSGKSYQSLSLTEDQKKDPTQISATETFTNPTTYPFLEGRTGEASAKCSASLLLGKPASKGKCGTVMLARDFEQDPQVKRIKLGDGIRDGMLHSSPDIESVGNKPAKTDTGGKEGVESVVSINSQSWLESVVGCCDVGDTFVRKHGSHGKGGGWQDDPRANDATQKSSELFSCKNGEGHCSDSNAEVFSCQRVRVHFKQRYFSCARTYIFWPFPNRGSTRITSASSEACPAEPFHPRPRDFTEALASQNGDPPVLPSERTNIAFPDAATDYTPGTQHPVSPHSEDEKGEDNASWQRREEGQRIVAEKDGEGGGNQFSYSLNSMSTKFASLLPESKEPLGNPPSEMATLSSPREQSESSTDIASTPSTLGNGREADDSFPSPFPDRASAATATDSSTPCSGTTVHSFTLNKAKHVDSVYTPPTSLSSSPKYMVEAIENSLCDDETDMAPSPYTQTSSSPLNSDLFISCESSPLLPEEPETEAEVPQTKQHHNQFLFQDDLMLVIGKESSLLNSSVDQWLKTGINASRPLLSPIASFQKHSTGSLLSQAQGCSGAEEGNEENKQRESKTLSGGQMLQMVREAYSAGEGNKEDSKEDGDHPENEEQGNRKPEPVPSDPKLKASLTTGALIEPHSSPRNNEDDSGTRDDEGQSSGEESTSPSEMTSFSEGEEAESEVETAEDSMSFLLDEFTAYEQDILLVDVIQDDPDLFGNLPKESLLKLGPTRIAEALRTRTCGEVKTLSSRTGRPSWETERSLITVPADFSSTRSHPRLAVHEKEMESSRRPWRARFSGIPSSKFCSSEHDHVDANNNHVTATSERGQTIQTLSSQNDTTSPLVTMHWGNGPCIKNPADTTEFRRQKTSTYCRHYFSETLSCGFKVCRFQHVPVEGDEKFCVETVMRFSKNPLCLQKASAVFTGYYQNNTPGVYFSLPVLMSFMWALLKAGLVSNVISVLNISLAHKITPSPEFLLALFNFVREKSLNAFVPELIKLISKMASTGLVLSLDYVEHVQNSPEFQQTNSPISMSGSHSLSPSTGMSFPENLKLVHAIVELCTKQEDWRWLGEVFKSICQSNRSLSELGHVSRRITIALLSETKDKLVLPLAAFADTVCQGEGDNGLIKSFLGRIGVSLMFRYHKTHQWAKGRRVVEVLSRLKVNYSMLKGLFGNEDRASRCSLVSMATELFLLSGSVEGALNSLRDNEWFLSSSSWPCEPSDLEKRSHVLMRLAEKTSHRDALEILSNLPGLKEPSDFVDISRYSPLFNSHLQVCVDRQTLPVASDTVDFMFSKNLTVNPNLLKLLLHKLGKQNLWLRAREVFKHSLSVGQYPVVSAPPGSLVLTVPCRLGEIELALAFEMFITVNATAILDLTEATICLSITLKRTCTCEREYLSAGSRLLSATGILQPQLTVGFTAVNSSQEQVFTLDTPSARRWLQHNHLWAKEVWTHSPKQWSLRTTP